VRVKRPSIARGPWAAASEWLLAPGALGGLLCTAGWYLAAGKGDVAGQLSAASVSVAGLMLVIGSLCAWLVVGRKAVSDRSRVLLTIPEVTIPAAEAHGTDLVYGPRLGRFHRGTCPIADAKWKGASRSDHERAGRQPCGICQP